MAIIETDYKNYDVYIIHWQDTQSHHGWFDHDHRKENCQLGDCISVGILVEDNKKTVTLIQSIGANGDMADSITIPRPNITEMKKLKAK